ncbi:metalloregulator ArsR/SmtB family transcription factor [Ruminococcaceae bacterium OttesenSCG-928-I18]|nr:metalloregulator ArsR/SmtB family transcription factor [Ruminococcaceae bacterium OttesenSCG-928-I18]
MAELSIPHQHGGHLQEVLRRMPEEGDFIVAADVFGQLSDATRLRILWVLCHSEECVTNIAAAVGMSDPAVSHHLRILKKTGVIKSRRVGKEVHYTLADTEEAELIHRMIDDVFAMNCPNVGIR